jgi:hypothetical protein
MAIEALSNMDATIDNLAMQDAISEAKGLASNSSVDQNTCTAINENMSACKYIQQQQCCAAGIHQNQQNVLEVGCSTGSFKNINQTNTAESFASCQMTAGSSVTDNTSTDIINKTGQTGESKATGFDLSWIVTIVVVVVLGGVGGKYFMSKKKGKKPEAPAPTGGRHMRSRGGKAEDASGATSSKMRTFVRVVGILEIIAGIVCIILYITTKTKSLGPVIDKPFVRCEQTQIVDSEFKDLDDGTIELVSPATARSTFGQIKEKSQKDSSIIGYDFFPDDISINPKDIPDSQLGLGVFLSNVDSEDREKYNCPPINTEEERSISMLYEESNTLLLILGIVLVIGGILQVFLF